MLRSLYSGVSGVKSHQTYLDVTGNNIANANTVGFKRDVLQFRDMIYQTLSGASGPGEGLGGINPSKVGLGVKVGSIETIHTGGSLQSTGNPTDMAISGGGYFVIQNGNQQLFTRAGNFAMDRDGNLVMSGTGGKVQGYAYKEQIDPATGAIVRKKDTNLTAINIPIGQKTPAKATTLAAFRCNLCSTIAPKIPDLANNIPGGSSKVIRPHTYIAYGSIEATHFGAAAPAVHKAGDTFFDTGSGELRYYNSANALTAYVPPRMAGAEDIYYGNNTTVAAAGVYSKAFTTAGGAAITGPVVGKRVIVDGSGPGAPAAPPVKPGQTYLDTDAAGTIYTANALGTAWLATTTPAEANTAYATVGAAVINVIDSTGNISTTPPTHVMDLSSGARNVFTWNGVTSKWENINNSSALSPSSASVSNTDNMGKFSESMLKTHDHETKMDVFDSLGNRYTLATYFRKTVDRPADPNATPPVGAESEWDWYSCYLDDKGKPMPGYGEGAGTLVFGDTGVLKRTYYFEPDGAPVTLSTDPYTRSDYKWKVAEKDLSDPATKDVPTGKIVADFNIKGAEGKPVDVPGTPPTVAYRSNTITLDFLGDKLGPVLGIDNEPIDGVTQFGSPTTTKGRYQDGYAMGELNSWTVGGDGIINGSYTNGRLLPIAQIALAQFSNPAGLTKTGDTCFAVSANSGMPQIGAPGTGGAGKIEGGSIEMSNVDLSEEFVNLIRAQRGFQASTRVVTTSDQVLEELINMKR